MDGEQSMQVEDRLAEIAHDREIVSGLDEVVPWNLREFYVRLKYGCKVSTFYKYKVVHFVLEYRNKQTTLLGEVPAEPASLGADGVGVFD